MAGCAVALYGWTSFHPSVWIQILDVADNFTQSQNYGGRPGDRQPPHGEGGGVNNEWLGQGHHQKDLPEKKTKKRTVRWGFWGIAMVDHLKMSMIVMYFLF